MSVERCRLAARIQQIEAELTAAQALGIAAALLEEFDVTTRPWLRSHDPLAHAARCAMTSCARCQATRALQAEDPQ